VQIQAVTPDRPSAVPYGCNKVPSAGADRRDPGNGRCCVTDDPEDYIIEIKGVKKWLLWSVATAHHGYALRP
jgi:hypothetical protein